MMRGLLHQAVSPDHRPAQLSDEDPKMLLETDPMLGVTSKLITDNQLSQKQGLPLPASQGAVEHWSRRKLMLPEDSRTFGERWSECNLINETTPAAPSGGQPGMPVFVAGQKRETRFQ
ncbi:uncharacterized protein LOC144131398 isoform X2 [Amblyomma americanum]